MPSKRNKKLCGNLIVSMLQEYLKTIVHQVAYEDKVPADESFEPLGFFISALYTQPPKTWTDQKGFDMDKMDKMSVDGFLNTIGPDEGYTAFRTAIVELKLYRMMLKRCSDHLLRKVGSALFRVLGYEEPLDRKMEKIRWH